jgi:hypothetical protein
METGCTFFIPFSFLRPESRKGFFSLWGCKPIPVPFSFVEQQQRYCSSNYISIVERNAIDGLYLLKRVKECNQNIGNILSTLIKTTKLHRTDLQHCALRNSRN